MKQLAILLLAGIFTSCNPPASQKNSVSNKVNLDSLKLVLKNTDKAFSDLSVKKGAHDAFMAFVAHDGVLLRPYHMPIVGSDSLRAYLYSRPDSDFTLIWKPLFADVASSGDMGFTYGTYKFTVKSTKEMEEGTYATVWKPDSIGAWKFVLDTGNPGLTQKKEIHQ